MCRKILSIQVVWNFVSSKQMNCRQSNTRRTITNNKLGTSALAKHVKSMAMRRSTEYRTHKNTWAFIYVAPMYGCVWSCACMRCTHIKQCVENGQQNSEQPMNWAHDDTDVMPRYEFESLTKCQCLCDRRTENRCLCITALANTIHWSAVFICFTFHHCHFAWLLGSQRETEDYRRGKATSQRHRVATAQPTVCSFVNWIVYVRACVCMSEWV